MTLAVDKEVGRRWEGCHQQGWKEGVETSIGSWRKEKPGLYNGGTIVPNSPDCHLR